MFEIDVISGRRLRIRESVAIRGLFRQIAAEDEALPEEDLVRSSTPPCAIILGAYRRGGLIIGMTFFAPFYKTFDEWGYIWNGAVDEQDRGRGLGTKLVKQASVLAIRAEKRYLLAITSIPATQAFLCSCGFVKATGPILQQFRSLKPRDEHGAFFLDLKR